VNTGEKIETKVSHDVHLASLSLDMEEFKQIEFSVLCGRKRSENLFH
jgi:hypothetical protein